MSDQARDPRLFGFMTEREAIIEDVVQRVVRDKVVQAHLSREKSIAYVLNEAAYLEMQRLERGASKLDLKPYSYWHQLSRKIGRASEHENARTLQKLCEMYTRDVAGNFTPQVYKFASRVLPVGLNVLFQAQRPDRLLRNFQKLTARIRLDGHIERWRKLSELGTLIVVPTHTSNLDSIVVGWGLEEAGLPPVTYGAGKNLFVNPLTGYFMHNLGAYKVDRRIRHTLYKEVLKTYSEVLLERGYHSLFFPGGTRSRSNRVERNLKLGLLGTALTSYTHNLQAARRKPKIFICPLTINYHLVLEGETLIDDHLRTDGGARYIIEDDEFADVRRVTEFVLKTMQMSHNMVLRFGEPLDVFGNPVDDAGESLDPLGRPVDAERYLWVGGEVKADRVRDAEYTRACGQAVARAFERNTVVLKTSFLAFVLFKALAARYPQIDLFRLLRIGKGELIPFDAVYRGADALRRSLTTLADDGGIALAPDIRELPIPALVDEASRVLGMYHTSPVVQMRANGVEVHHPSLVHFYGNRLDGFGLDDAVEAAVR